MSSRGDKIVAWGCVVWACVLWFIIMCIILAFVGCRTTSSTTVQRDSIYMVKVQVDTLIKEQVKWDSLLVFKTDTMYVDSAGVWHKETNKETTHYIYRYFAAKQSHAATDTLAVDKSKDKEVIKEVHTLLWWQSTLLYIGILGIVLVIIFGVVRIRGLFA